jgi:hypothetical protein
LRINRRAFVGGTGILAATTPSIAYVLLASARPLPALRHRPAQSMRPNGPVFRIEGWSLRDEVAIDDAAMRATDSARQSETADEVWIKFDRSWRTAWR